MNAHEELFEVERILKSYRSRDSQFQNEHYDKNIEIYLIDPEIHKLSRFLLLNNKS